MMETQQVIQVLKRLKMRCEHLRQIKTNGGSGSHAQEVEALEVAIHALEIPGFMPRVIAKGDPINRLLGLE